MKVAIVLRRPPYGDINAAEAVRHALGAVSSELEVSLILLDGGVLLSKKGHDAAGTDVTALDAVLMDCIEMGVGVYAEKSSLIKERVEEKEMVQGVKTISGAFAAELIGEAGQTMIF